MLANWMGYVLLAGLVFSLQAAHRAARTGPSAAEHLRLAGLVLLVVAAAYLAICAFSRRRHFELRGHDHRSAVARLACLQLLMGAGNWLIMSCILLHPAAAPHRVPAVVSRTAAGGRRRCHHPHPRPAWACWRRCLSPCSRT
jgi:hypothetical protein